MTKRLGFIGAGQMARALAGGFLDSGKVTVDDMVASDTLAEAREAWQTRTGCRALEDNVALVQQSDVVILAVKPQVMGQVLGQIHEAIGAEHLVVSIAAGVPIVRFREALGADRRIVRVMPNTPCLVGASAAGFAIGGGATDEDAAYVESLLGCVGVAFRLAEPLLDAVTGLSGSGPAYVYQIIEALSDGGVRVGLPRNVATTLAAQTLLGAAKMVLETGQHPGSLKDMVTSPGGTTITGLSVLERRALRGALIEAVQAATERSRELGAG